MKLNIFKIDNVFLSASLCFSCALDIQASYFYFILYFLHPITMVLHFFYCDSSVDSTRDEIRLSSCVAVTDISRIVLRCGMFPGLPKCPSLGKGILDELRSLSFRK